MKSTIFSAWALVLVATVALETSMAVEPTCFVERQEGVLYS